jgi:hypothetical protein
MADIADQNANLREHRRTFVAFERLVLFAILHVLLMLICLALAFLAHIPLISIMLGVGGTIALIALLAIGGSMSDG